MDDWGFDFIVSSTFSVHAQLFQVVQLSNQQATFPRPMQSTKVLLTQAYLPLLARTVSKFGYWTIDGIRQTGSDGRSLTQVSSVINAASTYKAFYFQESADTDSDGIMDWFEYRMWGDLSLMDRIKMPMETIQQPTGESARQDPLIIDWSEDGGISSGYPTGFVYADTSMVLATIKSDPPDSSRNRSNFVDLNTPSQHIQSLERETNGYHFAYWSVNGIRQEGPNGSLQ